jgi:hypothetical protein
MNPYHTATHHEHIEIHRYHNLSGEIIPIFICKTDSSQVIFGQPMRHEKTEFSVDYFDYEKPD